MTDQNRIQVDPQEMIRRMTMQVGEMNAQLLMQQIAVDDLTAHVAALTEENQRLASQMNHPAPRQAVE